MDIKTKLENQRRKLTDSVKHVLNPIAPTERQQLMLGKLLSNQLAMRQNIDRLADAEFSVFSQWGDDGIIQWLVRQLEIENQTFIEFGVEDYRESNTRFLMMNNNWEGLIMDGSQAHIDQIMSSEYYWMYALQAKAAFIDADNINELIDSAEFEPTIGLLHIDIDGNDYWVWKAIHTVHPVIVIVEYNSVFGRERAITVPYDKTFNRTSAHPSNLYSGASLAALCQLGQEKGYAFVGCNGAGNNAYFVRSDRLTQHVQATTLAQGYVESKFRESRDANGNLTYLTGPKRLEAIRGLPVFNTQTQQLESL